MTPPKAYPCLHLSHYDFCIPSLGFGTYHKSRTGADGKVKKAVLAALRTGYRHIDTAALYGCEEEVGEALKEWIEEGGKREDVFVTTKL